MLVQDIIFYIMIFILGTVFGSFFTLAIYRIPKKQDIVHTHSYCPNCNHKLGFLDLIPVFSYLFLGAKCRYCKEKIRPRYFIIEILSGLVFVSIAYLMNLSIANLNYIVIIDSIFMVLYLCFIFILAGIDKENRKIEKSVVYYGIIISLLYIAYLCIIGEASIYRYVIYIIFDIILLILDRITLKKYAKNSYLNNIILTVIVMSIFTGEFVTFNTIIYTLIAISLTLILHKIKNLKNKSKKEEKQIYKTIPVGFYIAVFNIIYLLYVLLYNKIAILWIWIKLFCIYKIIYVIQGKGKLWIKKAKKEYQQLI